MITFALQDVPAFTLPAGGAKTQPVTVDIPTNDEPVAGTVYGCSDVIPAYLQ